MEKVSGIGGLFFRVREPLALKRWYRDNLRIPFTPADYTERPWQQAPGPTVFEPFPEKTGYFGNPKNAWMVNFRVSDLDAMIARLRSAGIEVTPDPEKYPNGRCARVYDPEGNAVELWEPA